MSYTPLTATSPRTSGSPCRITMCRTTFGRSWRAIGFAPEGARFAGLPVERRIALNFGAPYASYTSPDGSYVNNGFAITGNLSTPALVTPTSRPYPTGQSFQLTRPLCRNRSARGWSLS